MSILKFYGAARYVLAIDIAKYFSDDLSENEKEIVKKRTRYNAEHTFDGKPIAH